ncbi:MAG: hypothetical protein ACLTTH_02335 [Holdemanella porci]
MESECKENMSYNIWAAAKTRNGLAADEVISTLQKSIRRNKVEEACQAAYELYITGPLFLDKLWRRLLTISVEDIGFGNLQAAVQVNTLNEVRKSYAYDDGDPAIVFYPCDSFTLCKYKDRSSDYLKNIIIKEAAMGKIMEVPDIALDKHTKRGQEMGRGSKHFFEEGTKGHSPVEN